MKQQLWVSEPTKIPFPFTILGTDSRMGTLVEISFPDEEPAYTLQELKKDIDRIKAKIGA